MQILQSRKEKTCLSLIASQQENTGRQGLSVGCWMRLALGACQAPGACLQLVSAEGDPPPPGSQSTRPGSSRSLHRWRAPGNPQRDFWRPEVGGQFSIQRRKDFLTGRAAMREGQVVNYPLPEGDKQRWMSGGDQLHLALPHITLRKEAGGALAKLRRGRGTIAQSSVRDIWLNQWDRWEQW